MSKSNQPMNKLLNKPCQMKNSMMPGRGPWKNRPPTLTSRTSRGNRRSLTNMVSKMITQMSTSPSPATGPPTHRLFREMKKRNDAFHTPFVAKPFHCPAFLGEESKLPRAPTKEEYFDWRRGDGLKPTRPPGTVGCSRTGTHCNRALFYCVRTLAAAMKQSEPYLTSGTSMFGRIPP